MADGYEALDMSETSYVKGMRKTNNSNKARPVSLSNNVGGQQQQQQQHESHLGAASNKRNVKANQEKVGGEFTGPLTSPMIGSMEGWMVLLLLGIVIAFGFLIAALIPIFTVNKIERWILEQRRSGRFRRRTYPMVLIDGIGYSQFGKNICGNQLFERFLQSGHRRL